MKISIVSYASGYTYDIYDRFIGTLNNSGFTGKIYILIKNNDIDNLIKIQEKYNNVITYLDTLEVNSHINCHRFFVIQEFLNKNYIENEYVFLCDFRDILFQKNIELYNHYDDSDLYVFLEGIKIIQDKNFNTPWLLELEKILDDAFYETICNNNIICCGTTLGKINAIKEYVNQMCKILLDYKISNNLDQGIHNYLIYLNKLPLKIKILNNTDNLVNTVGFDIHRLNDDNFITNHNNSISFVVHQYNRFCLDYTQRLSDKFGFNFNI
jgi:hypothetical protein